MMDLTREQLTDDLDEGLEREYQAVMAFVAHARLLKSARKAALTAEWETPASEALQQALTICSQVDDLGDNPTVELQTGRQPAYAVEMSNWA